MIYWQEKSVKKRQLISIIISGAKLILFVTWTEYDLLSFVISRSLYINCEISDNSSKEILKQRRKLIGTGKLGEKYQITLLLKQAKRECFRK